MRHFIDKITLDRLSMMMMVAESSCERPGPIEMVGFDAVHAVVNARVRGVHNVQPMMRPSFSFAFCSTELDELLDVRPVCCSCSVLFHTWARFSVISSEQNYKTIKNIVDEV